MKINSDCNWTATGRSQNSQENICIRVSFLIKLQPLGLLIVLLNNFAWKHTLTAQNCGASVRLQHWGNLMTVVFFIHFIDFCHQPNRNQVFSILEHVLSQFSKVINMNFAFGKLHLLTATGLEPITT